MKSIARGVLVPLEPPCTGDKGGSFVIEDTKPTRRTYRRLMSAQFQEKSVKVAHARVPFPNAPKSPCRCKASKSVHSSAMLDPIASSIVFECFRSCLSTICNDWPSQGKVWRA